jgi:membrane protein involved in colicin uptake
LFFKKKKYMATTKKAATKKSATKKTATKKAATKKAATKKSNDPCWDGYEKIGMKKKGGKSVPNCVPEKK